MLPSGNSQFDYFEQTGVAPALLRANTPVSENTYAFPFQTREIVLWTTSEPDLTVEDLGDSIEAMLARRESGLAAPATLAQVRSYPTDPSTEKSAVQFLKKLQEDGNAELEALNAQIETETKAKAKAEAKAKADREAFEAFQAKQQSSNPS